MRYLIPLLLCAVAAAEERPVAFAETVEDRFEATVTALMTLNDFKKEVKLLDSDPRFVFTLKTESGEIDHYAIHSVVLFFGMNAKAVAGKKFTFVRKRVLTVGDGKLLSTRLTVDWSTGGGK